jgi:hypothetical protein
MEIRLDKQPLRFVHCVNQLIGCHVRRWRETRVFKQKYISWLTETSPADITRLFLVILCLYVCQLAVIQALWHPINSMGNQVHGTQSLTMCCRTKRTSRGRPPGTYWMVRWVCLTPGACTAEKREVPYFCGESSDDLALKPVTQSVWGYLTGRTDKNPEKSY